MSQTNTFGKRQSFFIGVLCLFLIMMSTIAMSGASKVVADGSFVQAWLCGSWTDARWQQEFTAMKNAGMHYLVIGPVAECTAGEITQTLYPSTLPNTELDSGLNGRDMVDICLRNAETFGIKVFIGISSNDLWWSAHGADTTWLYNQMEFDNKVCDEVWSLYKSKYPTAFYGWYWAYEVDNVSFSTEAQQNELMTAMNIQLDHLSSTNEKLPFMWCPFMNSSDGTPQAYQAMWQNVLSGLHTTTGDIFCPQDCIGAGGLNLSNLASWFASLFQAVNTKTGLVMWSDVETFIESDWTSATWDRIIKQMQIEQPYVDNYMTFAYCHYQSPNNIDPGFQATYVDYLNTGTLEATPPTIPANFTAILQTNGNVALNWDASKDSIGVCGYYIYRNGIEICKKQVSRLDGATKSTPLVTSLTDAGLNSSTNYTYYVKAYDFAGNISDSTSQITINTGNSVFLPNKISGGCSYTVSIPANASYPDENNTKLTDGSYARIASKGDPAWEGVYDTNETPRDVVIDLGRDKLVQQFIADYLYIASSVYLPAQIDVLVSTDNVNFTDVGNLTLPNIPPGTLASSYKCINTLSSAVGARYVKYRVTPGGSCIFDDEYEVRSNDVTGIETEKEIPGNYSLFQNYPNPFNPTTIIQYNVLSFGKVVLKVYDLLGREVATLVDKQQNAGQYSVFFNASRLSSGVYFYKIQAGSYTETKKMMLIK